MAAHPVYSVTMQLLHPHKIILKIYGSGQHKKYTILSTYWHSLALFRNVILKLFSLITREQMSCYSQKPVHQGIQNLDTLCSFSF